MATVAFSKSSLAPRTIGSVFTIGDADRQAEALRESALFTGLPAQACNGILQYARRKTFASDEVLFSQGQIRDKWIFIQRGTVKLTQLSFGGSEVILWMYGPGGMVGVHAGKPEGCHTCSAQAMDQCRTLIWDRRGVEAILERYPQVEANIGKILANRLNELEERFCEVARESVAVRLALLLQRLCRLAGKPGTRGTELRIRRQELAQMTGTTLFTVSRILSRWANLGLVDPFRIGITVRDPDRLVACAQ